MLLRLINAFAGPYVLSHRVHARHVTSRIDSNKLIEFPRYRAQSPVSPILFRGHNFGFSTSRQADKRVRVCAVRVQSLLLTRTIMNYILGIFHEAIALTPP